MIIDFLNNHLMEILTAVLTVIGGWIGTLYKNKITNETTQNIIEKTVKYVEQVGKELGGVEKYELAREKASDWLACKGIKISNTEIEILIEAAVEEFKQNM